MRMCTIRALNTIFSIGQFAPAWPFVHSEVNNSYLDICSPSRRDFFLLGTAPEKTKLDLNVTCRTLTFVN